MADPGWLLAQECEMEAIKARIEGMKAENQHRLNCGNSLAYDDEAFVEKARELETLAQYILNNR